MGYGEQQQGIYRFCCRLLANGLQVQSVGRLASCCDTSADSFTAAGCPSHPACPAGITWWCSPTRRTRGTRRAAGCSRSILTECRERSWASSRCNRCCRMCEGMTFPVLRCMLL